MEETEKAFLAYLEHPIKGMDPLIIILAKGKREVSEILKTEPGFKIEKGKIKFPINRFSWGECKLRELSLVKAKR